MTTLIEWIIVIILFAVFFISAIVTTIVIFYKRRWNFSYVVLEKGDGKKYAISSRGKCRMISFGDGGEEIFYLRNTKKWRVAYGKRIAKNQIMWVIGQDGYWYNADFDDFDRKLMKIGVMPIDRDMRYAYASVRKGIDNRYEKQNFMDKYGTLISFGLFFILVISMIGFQWFNFSQQKKMASTNLEASKVNRETMELASDVLKNIDNIKSGGSGAVEVPNENTPRPVIPATPTA